MIKIILGLLLYLSSVVHATYVLGTVNHKVPKSDSNYTNSIIFSFNTSKWSASKPLVRLSSLQKNNKFILINNSNINYKAPNYLKETYHYTKGWNCFRTTKNGLDVLHTFQKAHDVSFVFVYDKLSSIWAGFSPNKEILAQMMSTRVLYLKDIEPNKKFFLYATASGSIKIKSLKIDKICKKLLNSSQYKVIGDSGNDSIMHYTSDGRIGIQSRYFSHFKRGVYSDSRVLLLYPKLKKMQKGTANEKYGPIKPKIILKYSKEYENRYFYIYDYYEKKCFKGIFPSIKVPPFATLQKIIL